MYEIFLRVFASLCVLSVTVPLHARMQTKHLTCEMMQQPLNVATLSPRLGWLLTSDVPGDKQTAYQVIVSSENAKNEGDIWNTGKIKSSQSQLVTYKGKQLQAGQRYYWTVKVWDQKGNVVQSETTFFETAPVLNQAQWIGAITREKANLPIGRRDLHAPSFKKQENMDIYASIDTLALKSIQLRKTFNVNKTVAKTLVHVSGLGHYQFSLNGEKISRDIFTPAWSDYDKTVYYNTYQVDSLLTKGKNTIGITLGNGFYNAVGNRYRKLWISFGPPTLYLEMEIYYTDGSKETILSDQSWKYALSPIIFNDIYGGEDYDARLEQTGWDQPAFDDSLWKPVVIQEAPKGMLRPQQQPPVREMEQYGAKTVKRLEPGVYVLDMGQNLSGYPAIQVKGKKGQSVKMIVGELLNEDGTVSQKRTGGPHTYTYILKGEGIESWHPEFTYYGFQYIQVEGADLVSSDAAADRPLVVDIKSHFIYNSTAETGNFTCSNDIFTKTHILIDKAIRSNMHSIFTDCPQREKLGWLEQTHLNGPGLFYNFDLTQMYPKLMQDIMDAQWSNGLVPSIVPEYTVFAGSFQSSDDFTDSPEWGSASVIVPWMYYKFYGDNSLITNYYETMKRYVDYLGTKATNHILSHGLGDWYDYGDHPAGWSKNSPIEVSATSHYYYVAHLLAKSAGMLKKTDDLKKYNMLASDIRDAFNNKFFKKETKQYANGSQFSNAVAVYMGIVEPQYKAAVLGNLKENIHQHGNRLTTGDIGNRYLYLALALNDENELMYLMHNHEETPGYGFQLKYGVTTLTEQWDPRKGNSWNHFMMGQIDEWFYRFLAGINPVTPGFKEFRIQPSVIGDLTWVKAHYTTLYGTIHVDWKKENNLFFMNVEVPVNTQATVVLPNGKKQVVGSGKHTFEVNM